jgi:hypothetical protein
MNLLTSSRRQHKLDKEAEEVGAIPEVLQHWALQLVLAPVPVQVVKLLDRWAT